MSRRRMNGHGQGFGGQARQGTSWTQQPLIELRALIQRLTERLDALKLDSPK